MADTRLDLGRISVAWPRSRRQNQASATAPMSADVSCSRTTVETSSSATISGRDLRGYGPGMLAQLVTGKPDRR